MHTILPKLRSKSADEAIDHIFKTRSDKGFCVVNYLYGANIIARGLFEEQGKKYHEALASCDILLPDGIALQLLCGLYFLRFKHRNVWLSNLNGTDFLPQLLEKARETYDLKLILFGTYPHIIEKSAKLLQDKGYNVVYYQDGYRPFDWEAFEKTKNAFCHPELVEGSIRQWPTDQHTRLRDVSTTGDEKDKNISFRSAGQSRTPQARKPMTIFIQGRVTLTNPIQELRTLEHMDKIKEHKFIVCNQSGTFDHSDRGGTEKRVPGWIRTIKLERLRRTIINPQKGIGKVKATLGLIPLVLSKIVLQTKTKKIQGRYSY